MNILQNIINGDAFQAMLLGMLSCGCPITPQGEEAVVRYWHSVRSDDLAWRSGADFDRIMELLGNEPTPTPFHSLRQYCINFSDTPLKLHIFKNDVLRYLGSQYHYGRLTSGLEDISDAMSPFIAGHMLLPVRMNEDESALYCIDGAKVTLKNLCFPNWGLSKPKGLAAVHLGMILCDISSKEYQMLLEHQGLIPDLVRRVKQLSEIDFSRLPVFGDHCAHTKERLEKYDTLFNEK